MTAAKSWMILLCVVFWLPISLGATENVVRVAIDAEYAPYEFVDSNGKVKGFLPDLLREIGQTSAITFKFIPMSWPDAVKGLESGRVDLINMIRTEKRVGHYEFSEPHSGIVQALFRNKKHADIEGIESLSGSVVALQQYDIALEKLADRNDFDRLIVTNKQDGFIKLNSGEVAAFLTATQPGLYFMKLHGLRNVELVQVNLWPQDFCFTAKKGNVKIISLINGAMVKLRSSGRYDEIFNAWMKRPDGLMVKYEKPIIILISLLLLLFAIAFIWNVMLRRAVDQRTSQLHDSEDIIRTLYQISTESQRGLEYQIGRLLELGCQRFNLEIGILSHIIHEDYEVMHKHCPAEMPLNQGDHFELGCTYCVMTMEAEKPVVYHHVKQSEISTHPAYKAFALESYIGTRVIVRGQVFGTLNFSSPTPMKRSFKDVDVEALQLMAAWLGNELSRVQNEVELLHSQKMEAIGTLVGGIAHDFNNTLAAIQGNLYLAKSNLNEKEQLMSKLGNVERLGSHAAEMVQQLLTFARKGLISKRSFSLTSFMAEEFKLSRSIIPENIEYISSICDENLQVLGDSSQIQQVLLNLLNNARDAVQGVEKPVICCSLESFTASAFFQQKHPTLQGGRLAHLIIEDNGCGLSVDDLTRIFEPFYTTKPVGEGTGLGLSMVYGAVQTHGGIIEVNSKLDQGTMVHIYLPLNQHDEPLVIEKEDQLVEGRGETLLLVDDEEDMLEVISEVLGSMGYTVLSATNGEEAVALFKEHIEEISLVISDVVMPIMGGIAAVTEMRRFKATLPVIFATGYDKGESAAAIEAIAGSVTITKPFSFEQLSQLIDHKIHTE